MNYEEKYKEALERAKKFEEKYGGDYAGYIFPELAESEDERIRRTLVEYFGPQAQLDFVRGVPIQKIRDWLEKQKENPKSADSISSDCMSYVKCEDRDSNYGVFPEDVIVVARACEKLKTHGYPELAHALKNVNLYTKEQKPVDYDHEMWKNCEANFEGGKKEVIEHPEKYGLCKPAEWSEEDEYKLCRVIKVLEDNDSDWKELSNWLKSLRPSWKPSEEQMNGLAHAINLDVYDAKRYGLDSLYNDLKKLM